MVEAVVIACFVGAACLIGPVGVDVLRRGDAVRGRSEMLKAAVALIAIAAATVLIDAKVT